MELVLTLLIGLAIGSFLNVCIVRLPAEESVILPRSRCPRCRKAIGNLDNIPILSYLFLRGRCRNCDAKISARYPLVEALAGLVSVFLYFKFGFSARWFVYFVFCCALIVLAFVDADHRILPDPITKNGIWVGIAVNLILVEPHPFAGWLLRHIGIHGAEGRLESLTGSVLGALVGGGMLWAVGEAYFRVRGVEGMGGGDVKMMAMVGAFLGAPLVLLTIMVGSFAGSITGLIFMRLPLRSTYELPFGTFLGFAGIIAVLYGQDLLQMYVDRVIGPIL